MAPTHFIREWRKHRRMTAEDLAVRSGTSGAVVSRIERGLQRYNQEFLEAAAMALQCSPADLIMRDPGNSDIYEVWAALSPDRQAMALEIIKTLAKRDDEK